MKVLDAKQEDQYCDLMDELAILVYKETVKGMRDLGMGTDPNYQPEGSSEEIGWAMGQIVHDKMIELTKEMSREEILRFFTESAIALLVSAMTHNPGFFARMLLKSGGV